MGGWLSTFSSTVRNHATDSFFLYDCDIDVDDFILHLLRVIHGYQPANSLRQSNWPAMGIECQVKHSASTNTTAFWNFLLIFIHWCCLTLEPCQFSPLRDAECVRLDRGLLKNSRVVTQSKFKVVVQIFRAIIVISSSLRVLLTGTSTFSEVVRHLIQWVICVNSSALWELPTIEKGRETRSASDSSVFMRQKSEKYDYTKNVVNVSVLLISRMKGNRKYGFRSF
jgi:hypothetical protein